ncbi:MAG: FMN-binding protein [Kiritimatiellae bacterium]|nr:FMN-binding protein [Kiritimatiellia bacterium]
MPTSSERYVLVYAGVVCLLASVVLTSAATGLRRRQEQAAELDRKFNVLKAFGAEVVAPDGRRLPPARIEVMYRDHVRELWVDPRSGASLERPSGPEALPVYQWMENGRPVKTAIPVSGKGLWSTIYGYLALDAELDEIVGLTFYRHGETPGLGGEIEQPWFQDQFRGRRIARNGEWLPIVVAKGVASPEAKSDPHRLVVDGISGATLTGQGVTRFLNECVKKYEPYLRTARKG